MPQQSGNVPILHVVYAGRGDAMYVEYKDPQNATRSKLYVMDGGPRSGRERWFNKAYSQFFLSAGRNIWYTLMKNPPNSTIRVEAMVNSHLHADHVEGMIDMLKLKQGLLSIGSTGFIISAFEEKVRSAAVQFCTQVSDISPHLWLQKWNQSEFEGGFIEFPVTLVDQPDLYPTWCLSTNPEPGAEVLDSNELLSRRLTNIESYPAIKNIKTNRSGKDDLNFSSLLIHVPLTSNPTASPLDSLKGGIYLTGDNNANIISHFMRQRHEDLRAITPAAPVAKRHFTIYKIQHHGSKEDSQLVPSYYAAPLPDRKIDQLIVNETALLMTLVAAANNEDQYLGSTGRQWSQGKVWKMIGGKEGVERIAKWVTDELNNSLGDTIEGLKTRHKLYLQGAFDGKLPVYTINNGFDPSNLWRSMVQKVRQLGGTENNDRKHFYYPKNHTYTGPLANQTPHHDRPSYNPIEGSKYHQKDSLMKSESSMSLEPNSIDSKKKSDDKDDALLEMIFTKTPEETSAEIDLTAPQVSKYEYLDYLPWWRNWGPGKEHNPSSINEAGTGQIKNIWRKYYERRHVIIDIREFYRSFTAEAYVVSANQRDHGHPDPETVCGLALALREEKRTATLYITNPASIKVEEIIELCHWMGVPEDEPILDSILYIRYMYKHTMSLTANPGIYASNEATKDVKGLPIHVEDGKYFQNAYEVNRANPSTWALGAVPNGQETEFKTWSEERSTMLESATKWDALLVGMGNKFTITSGNKYAVKFDAGSNLDIHTITAQDPARELYIEQFWDGASNDDVNILRISKDENFLERIEVTVSQVGKSASSLYSIVWKLKPDGNRYTFCLGNNDVVQRVPFLASLHLADFTFDTVVHNVPAHRLFIAPMALPEPRDIEAMIRPLHRVGLPEEQTNKTPLNGPGKDSDANESGDGQRLVTLANDSRENVDDELSDAESAASNSTIGVNSTGVSDPEAPEGGTFLIQKAGSSVATRKNNGELKFDPDGHIDRMDTKDKSGDAKSTDIAKRNSFKNYFLSAGVKSDDMKTTRDILANMVRENNFSHLHLSRQHETELLDYPADYADDQSWIEFTDDGLSVNTNRALLQLKIPQGAKLSLAGGDPSLVEDAKIILESGVDQILRVGMLVSTRETNEDLDTINELRIVKILHKATGPASLAKIFRGMGVDATGLDAMTIAEALGIIIGNGELATSMIYDRLSTGISMLPGFVNLKPDWRTSIGRASYTATHDVYVDAARIEANFDTAAYRTSFDAGAALGNVSVKLKSVSIDVRNARKHGQVVILSALVTFSVNSHTAVDLRMSTLLSDDEPYIDTYFKFTKANSLDELLTIFGHKSADMNNIIVPFGGKSDNPKETRTLGKVDLKPGTFGFVLRQSVGKVPDLRLTRIFASTDLNSWREYLPSTFPKSIKNISVGIDLIEPFDSQSRTASLDVIFDLELTIRDGSKHNLRTSFSALPLVATGEFEYMLTINASAKGLSLAEVTDLIGLGDVVSKIGTQVPFIEKLLSNVFVRRISASVTREVKDSEDGITSTSSWVFSSWGLDVWLPKMELIPGVLALKNVDITISKIGQIEILAKAAIKLPDPVQIIWLDLRTPTKDNKGHIWLDVEDGVSLQNMLDAFNVGKYDETPLLGQLLQTELQLMEVSINESIKDQPLSLDHLFIRLWHPLLKIGPLEFDDVSLELNWNYGPVVPAGETRKSEKIISAKAHIIDSQLLASVEYDSSLSLFSASLEPVDKFTIGTLLKACLPSSFGGLGVIKPYVEELQLKAAGIKFTTDPSSGIHHFDFHVADETTMEVRRLILRELKIVYDNGSDTQPVIGPITQGKLEVQ